MIVDERIVTYIHSLEVPESEIIERIEQEALEGQRAYIAKYLQEESRQRQQDVAAAQ